MENPTEEITAVIYKLTTGSPRLQQQTLEHYFTPDASFHHPFCAVHGNRDQILSIFRWYKVMSPRIDIQVNGIAYEAARQKLYVDISQTFRLWPLIPLGYRADVNLLTVLQLTRDPSGHDSPFTSAGTEKPTPLLPSPPKYHISSQTDLYPVPSILAFISPLGLLPLLCTLFHALATYACVLGAWIFTPFTAAMQKWRDGRVEHRERVRRDGAVGPNFGVEERERLRERDGWEMEAMGRTLNGKSEGGGAGKVGKLGMGMEVQGNGKGIEGPRQSMPVMDWMKMEESVSTGR